MNQLKSEFKTIISNFNNSPPMQRLANGNLTVEHYKSLMSQIAHHARENPQLQVLATVYFRGRQREIIQTFFKHATSEIGHDQLALNDVAACGGDIAHIMFENGNDGALVLDSDIADSINLLPALILAEIGTLIKQNPVPVTLTAVGITLLIGYAILR